MSIRPIPTLFLLLAAFAVGCRPKPTVQTASGEVPVETVTVEQRDLPVDIPTVGTVEPLSSVQLKAKVGGEVREVGFADGAFVKAGQDLFQIDPSSYRAELQGSQANLAIAEAQAKNAADQLQRYSTLSSKGAASEEQYSQYVSAARQQDAEVKARKADVSSAQLFLDWTTVQAPITGRAGAALVKAGNIVQAENDVLTVINQLQPIYVGFSVPEAQLADVRARQPERPLRVEARNPTTAELIETGELTFIDNRVDTESGMVAMKATFANEGERLWPGQFVDVVINLDEDAGALIVPTVAILESQSGSRVFVVKDGVAELRDIEVERTHGEYSVIESGLAAGEQVVSNGQLRLKNGSRVTIRNGETNPEISAR